MFLPRRFTPPRFLVPLLAFSPGIATMAMTIYVPAMTDIAGDLQVQVGDVQLTLLVYLFGIALGQLIYGPLSDSFGRRRVLLAGLLLCLVASLACMLASSIALLIVARAAQALGACAGMVISRAIVGDLYDGVAATRALSMIGMIMTLMPLVSPMIGGNLDVHFGWRSAFLFIAILACLAIALIWVFLPETNPRDRRRALGLASMAATYRTLFRDREFMIYAVILFGGQFGSFSTIASAPVIIVGTLGISPDRYGYFSAVVSLGYLCGSALTNRVAGRISGSRMLLGVGYGQCTAAILMIGASLLPPLTPWHVIGPMTLYMFNNGISTPNAFAGAVSRYPRVAGTASALSGFLQGLGGVTGIMVTYLLPTGSAASLAVALAIGALIMFTGGNFLFYRNRRPVPPG